MDAFDNASIGNRLKMLRMAKGMTAREVAKAIDVSPAYISMLERGKSNYNLSLLLKLMDVYGKTLSDFLQPPKIDGRVHHLSDFHLYSEQKGKLRYYLLRGDEDPSVFRPYYFQLQPGGSTGVSEPHTGTEFIFVIEGEASLLLTDASSGIISRNTLKATDSMYYSSKDYHGVSNEGNTLCSFILVFSPYSENDERLSKQTIDHHDIQAASPCKKGAHQKDEQEGSP